MIALAALTPVAGGNPPQPEARLIDLNVVAVDDHGHPITDLTSDDFQVADAGKPQTIVYFHHNDSRLQQPRPLQPNEYSNRNAGIAPHVTLILLDQLNQRFDTRMIAANQIVRDLEPMESADDLYLYLLTVDGRFQAVHGFDEEGAAPAGGPPWTRQIKSLMDQATRASLRVRPAGTDVAVREQMTFAALDAIGAQLSRFPGRKNIVWITDGLPLALGPRRSDTGDFVDFTPQIRRLTQLLERSHIAIYPVRQVMLGSADAIDGATGVNELASLDEFASLTGGRSDGGKDIGAAVRQAVSDVRTSYQIGYFPPSRSWDGKFHKLRVSTKRRGVRIQTKSGYYAWPESPDQLTQAAIGPALAAPFDAGEIGVRGTLSPDANDPKKQRLDVRIDAGDLALPLTGGSYSAPMRVVIAEYGADGRIQDEKDGVLDLSYSAGERDKALQDGIGLTREIQVGGNGAQAAAKVRFVIFDPGSMGIGSITMPVGSTGESRR